MYRVILSTFATLALLVAFVGLALTGPQTARGDVGGVYADVPVFAPNQVVTVTVTAEDDDGTLVIESSLSGSELTVITCSGIGADQKPGECDGSGASSVFDQGQDQVRIDTNTLDEDGVSEPLTVSLTLITSCTEVTAVTISGDQPGNFGPDDVTINCIPATPSPTPSPTSSPTPSPTASATPTETATPSPTATTPPAATPQPPAAPTTTPFSEIQTLITPPSTGSAGLK